MPINANVTSNQIIASVGETKIDVSVSGGVGPTGSQGPTGPAGAAYTLPVATASVLGGVKIGSGISIDGSGVISVTSASVAWADITGKPTFATVATSGSYTDLTNKPTLFSGSYADLTNKPTLFDGSYTSLSNVPSSFTPSAHAASHAPDGADPIYNQNLNTTDNVAFARVDVNNVLIGPFYGGIVLGTNCNTLTFQNGSQQTTAWTGSVDWDTQVTNKPTLFSGAYGDLTGLPTLGSAAAASTSDFAAASHNHAASAITSGTLAVANGGTGASTASAARTNLSAQKTITSGTAAPTGGSDGDIYLQYV